jgi:hypothetical protein
MRRTKEGSSINKKGRDPMVFSHGTRAIKKGGIKPPGGT